MKPPVPSSAYFSWPRILARALGLGMACAMVGLLLGLRLLAIATLPHILAPGPEINIQEVLDGLPVPRLLDWNMDLVEWLMTLRGLHSVGLWGAAALVFGLLWLPVISTLDRTFRMFVSAPPAETSDAPPLEAAVAEDIGPGENTPSDATVAPAPVARGKSQIEATQAAAGALDGAQLGRALLRLLVVGIPMGFVWMVTALLPSEPAVTALRCIALGLALWLGFRREVGDTGVAAPSWGRLALTGALFGLGLFALSRCAMPVPSAELLARFQALGPFRRDVWNLLASRVLFSQGAAWFGAGALLVLMGRTKLTTGQRVGLLALPVIAGLLALWAQQPFTPAALASRYDTTPEILKTASPYDPTIMISGIPGGQGAARELAQRIGLTMGTQPAFPERSLLLFHPDGLFTARIAGYTENGLTATPDSVPKVRAFLEQRHFQTALSWVATKHLYDVGTTYFDQTSGLSACLLDLKNCPHPRQLSDATEAMIFTCTASPQNLALLDQWADETRFGFPDRESKKLMGQMYERVGETQKALLWYKKAEMPRSFMARVQNAVPNFHQGVVTGVLRLNGRPLAGVRVGALPIALKSLPDYMSKSLSGSRDRRVVRGGSVNDVLSGPQGYYHDSDFPDYHPRQHALRWICAAVTTDTNGAFTLNYLTAGDYLLVCDLPSNLTLTAPSDPALRAENAPTIFTLDTDKPEANLGTINIIALIK